MQPSQAQTTAGNSGMPNVLRHGDSVTSHRNSGSECANLDPLPSFGIIRLVKKDGGRDTRVPLRQRHHVLTVGPSHEQVELHVDENNQVWLSARGKISVSVDGCPVQGRFQLTNRALVEVGTQRCVFYAPRASEKEDPPSRPASSPFAKTSPTFSLPHPSPGAFRALTSIFTPSTKGLVTPSKSSPECNSKPPESTTSVVPMQMLLDAEQDARRIRAHAEVKAKEILARAEADAQRIRARALEEQEKRRCVNFANEAKSPSNGRRLSKDISMARAEKCLAFFDKLACINFLNATQHLSLGSEPELDGLSLEDVLFLLQKSGFSDDDIADILQELSNDRKEHASPPLQAEGKLCLHTSPGSPESRPLQDLSIQYPDTDSSTVFSASPMTVNIDLAEDVPSTPGKRAVSALGFSREGGGAALSNRLQPCSRKHPILTWLKRVDSNQSTSDGTLVKDKMVHDACRRAPSQLHKGGHSS